MLAWSTATTAGPTAELLMTEPTTGASLKTRTMATTAAKARAVMPGTRQNAVCTHQNGP